MPLLDSFCVDHTQMNAPGVRFAKSLTTPKGDEICVFDLRFCKPNVEMLGEKETHTFEHLFAGFMREFLVGFTIIDISPMGCRTGFYMSIIGRASFEAVREAWLKSCEAILAVEKIPEANKFQCGSFAMHSLEGAKRVAADVLKKGICELDNEALKLNLNLVEN